jgi:Transglutaminase-like superfamily
MREMRRFGARGSVSNPVQAAQPQKGQLNNLRRAPRADLVGPKYRTVSEADMVGSLLVAAQPFELAQGGQDTAVARTRAALDTWKRQGLGYQLDGEGQCRFDPVEVINHMKWVGLNGLDDFWSRHFVRTGRSFAAEFIQPRAKSQKDIVPARERFHLTLLRRFDLCQLPNQRRLRLRLPLPLDGFAKDIDVTPILPAELIVRTTQSDGRLEFHADGPCNSVIEIGAEIYFATNGHANDLCPNGLDAQSRDIYTRASEGLIRITPRIKDLADSLSQPDPLQTVKGCFNYIIDELSCGMVRYDQIDIDAPGDWVLDSGWYDCQLGSALLVSLCRALEIPSRLVSGQMLYRLGPGFHYWAEVWIPDHGWLPFDFLCWDLSEGGRDALWREYFAGRVDCRMVTQCLPLSFTGPMSVRFPPAWHLINAPTPQGMRITFSELNGGLIYSDNVIARRLT